MSGLIPPSKLILAQLLLLSLLAFGFGFFISFRQEKNRVLEEGQLAWLHLTYALDLRDDMAVIDWSKNLEALEGVSAFQAKAGPKILAEGGNRDYLEPVAGPGIYFLPPSRWIFFQRGTRGRQDPREFTFVDASSPGPLLWGFFGFAACLAGSIISVWLFAGFSPPTDSPSGASAKKPEPGEGPLLIRPAVPTAALEKRPFLFLDKQFVIQEVSPEASLLLQRDSADLLQGHIFDLKPDPSLMKAMEKNEEVKLLTPFLSYPHLLVFLKPDPNGTLLFLESLGTAGTAQKH